VIYLAGKIKKQILESLGQFLYSLEEKTEKRLWRVQLLF